MRKFKTKVEYDSMNFFDLPFNILTSPWELIDKKKTKKIASNLNLN